MLYQLILQLDLVQQEQLISGQNNIDYTSKTINQFFGCTGVGVKIEHC